jgi:hypothetical protein
MDCTYGVRILAALAAGQVCTVNNCIFSIASVGVWATTVDEFVEDYNSFYACTTVRTNVNAGANSVAYPPLFAMPILLDGIRYPWQIGALSQWSALRAIAGTGMAADDLYGVTRPVTDSKKSWGAVQYPPISRETTTKRTGAASIKLADAGRFQVWKSTNGATTQITISCYVYFEADYAGDLPQLIVHQPGQSDATDTATGAAENWEALSVTLTPAASPGYVVAELVSRNTATSGSFGCYFDDLAVA